MYASILFVLLKNFSLRYTILAVIAIALTITFADQVCATLIRPQVQRSRPSRLGPLIQENNEKSIRLMEALGQLKDKNGQYPIEKIRLHERKPGDFYRGRKIRISFLPCLQFICFSLFPFAIFQKKRLKFVHSSVGCPEFLLPGIHRSTFSRRPTGRHGRRIDRSTPALFPPAKSKPSILDKPGIWHRTGETTYFPAGKTQIFRNHYLYRFSHTCFYPSLLLVSTINENSGRYVS